MGPESAQMVSGVGKARESSGKGVSIRSPKVSASRVASVRAVSQQMAVGSVPAAPVIAAAPSAKAVDDASHLFAHLAAETWAALTKPWSKT